ncbi:hypothetical protein T492DRAFT_97322 [Pavlovales sp. CCMP2436]|nr:hypothetical protein T492DRAFT_97322 [Pavlovales sp. CCMP2436]
MKWRRAALVALLAVGADGGIAGLQTWFRRKFPSAFEPISDAATRDYEHVLIDMNQVLHHAVRKANDVEHARILVFMELNVQLQRCVPTRSVVLAFDGPGPRAKLLTQRRRRAKRRTPAGKLSSDLISPGSAFMRDMHAAVTYYACRRLQNDEAYRNVRWWISGSQVAGEGEVKPGFPDTRSVCVIGSDVDLVLQCISALPRLMSTALPSAQLQALASGAVVGGDSQVLVIFP